MSANGKKQRISGVIVVAIMIMAMGFVSAIAAKAADEDQYSSIEEINISDFDSWQSGWYQSWDGQYAVRGKCICLDDYVVFEGSSYDIKLGSSEFCLLITEMNANKRFIKTVQVTDGDTYSPSENAVYLAITFKRIETDWCMNYDKFTEMFKSGFEIGIIGEKKYPADSVEACDLSDFDSWQSGWYQNWDGKYAVRGKCICLTEYKTFVSEKYSVSLGSDEFCLLISEFNANDKCIKNIQVTNGDTYIPSENAVYLGITFKRIEIDWGMNYDKFAAMFEEGYEIRLIGQGETIQSTTTPGVDQIATPAPTKTPTLTPSPTPIPTLTPVPTATTTPTATPTPKVYSSFREELKDMLLTGDMTTHDVWKYKITYNKMMNIYNELIADECYVAYKSYVNAYLDYTSLYTIVRTVSLVNADENFAYRYEKIQEAREEALSLITPEMSEVEKVLILQEYLAKKTSYEFSDYCRVVSGPLVYGKAVCAGYARTLQFLLHEAGIDSYYTASETMNHGWLMVRVDGELYHVDPTWDDNKGSLHTFFMRNDNEYQNHPLKNHYDWYIKDTTETLTSTSTKYENWFVHDVKGVMAYYEGYWYYGDGKTIKKAKIDGSDMSIVSEEDESVLVKEIKNGTLIYTVNNVRKTIKLSV